MNEWGFAGEIKSWWDAVIEDDPSLGLGRVIIEKETEGERKRADITLCDASDKPLMVLELRLPDHPDSAPSSISNITNAMNKAAALGARWSATSDGEIFRLLDQSRHDRPLLDRAVPVPPLATPTTRASLDVPAQLALIRSAWVELVRTLAPVLTGRHHVPQVPPDEFFVDALKGSLARPLAAVRDAIAERQASDASFREELIRWMVDEQNWVHDATKILDEINRVAQVSTYVFATRLLFYGALRRAEPTLPPLDLPSGGNPAATQAAIASLFEQAQAITGDYQTVFIFDPVCKWALISQESCKGWLNVIELLESFQLESISYDVLGRLFERLIDPHERYRWGQHYTSPDVVDLMLSAALPDGIGTVLDPACGGGTFLVRAYTRKRAYDPHASHEQRLSEIAGCDVSAFAASVATVNLASQNLATGANYPRVRAGSFFRVSPGGVFIDLPDGGGTMIKHVLPPIDAVVCNPPYIKFADIGEDRRAEADAAYAADRPGQRTLKYRFNYHLYFWFHSASFLNSNARMSFITSGEWLDSDYGQQLQEWLLSNFHIELVIESLSEPWFGEARVGTVVFVVRKWTDADDKTQAKIRFVILRKPLHALYSADTADDTVRLLSVDAFRDRLITLEGIGESDDFDYSVVSQKQLRELGTDEEGRYLGLPWRSRYLRSPKIAEELSKREGFVELGEIADIALGGKTGADEFFYLTPTGQGTSAKPVLQGLTGWEGAISRSNTSPALRNPRDLDTTDGRRFVVPTRGLVRYFSPSATAREQGVRDYVAHGESSDIHRRTLVQQNSVGGKWYLQGRQMPSSNWVMPYNSAYDYFAADNSRAHAVLNGRFVGVDAKHGVDPDLLGAVLNSTFALLARLLEGVATGNEGAYDVGPPAARRMKIPDPRIFSEPGISEVRATLQAIRAADRLLPAPSSHGEVNPLRRTLDLSILHAMGVAAGDAAILLDRVYTSYARWRKSVESVEDQVQENRRALSRRGGSRATDPVAVARNTVSDEIGHTFDIVFPTWSADPQSYELIDAVRPSEDAQDALLPQTSVRDTHTGQHLDLGKEQRVRFVRAVRDLGWPGPVPVPVSDTECATLAEQIGEARSRLETEAAMRAAKYVAAETVGSIVSGVVRGWCRTQCENLRRAIESEGENGVPQGSERRQELGPSLFDTNGLVPTPPESESDDKAPPSR
ncbi:HsdM family class I SAM-dependent methyltransferase [Mycobacterium kyorinense]|uniref:HsdM family class I SAM-dependent methyltransferase n=1 Tax=Mycobacterium kyorinense TaxID=487514 RepID=UPI0009DE9A51|nr:N-6 DNA methylase [Mycobacterium kyorinense]